MTIQTSRCLCIALLLALPLAQAPISSQAAQQGPKLATASDISEVLNQQIKEHHLAGMAGVVVRADGVVAVGVAGLRHLGESAPIKEHDLFHLGSNTKAMTATMIARLIDTGKLKWATAPLDVFPEMKDSIHPAFKSITLEQLFSHNAGIPPYTDTDSKGSSSYRNRLEQQPSSASSLPNGCSSTNQSLRQGQKPFIPMQDMRSRRPWRSESLGLPGRI